MHNYNAGAFVKLLTTEIYTTFHPHPNLSIDVLHIHSAAAAFYTHKQTQ